MAFPEQYVPSSRQFVPGDWPVKSYQSLDGTEVRLLYGSRRTQMQLDLQYSNIADSVADAFIAHYGSTQGTYQSFPITSTANTFKGWEGASGSLNTASGNRWRYREPPKQESVRPGVSTVTVSLVGVLG